MKQAECTAGVQSLKSSQDSKESERNKQKARSAVEEIFVTLEGSCKFVSKNPSHKNQELTPKDKAKLQILLKEFLENQYPHIPPLENDFEIPPTLLAVLAYDKIHQALNDVAPYAQIKLQSIQKARSYKQKFLESLHEKLSHKASAKEVLEFAIRICVLGNVLDYGAQKQFDLEEQAQKILQSSFAYFDLRAFMSLLEFAKNLVVIGDNAGENEFDEILIYALKALYPTLEIFYFVRGAEIINDITLLDLKKTDSAMLHLATVVDSGVRSPGFIESLACKKARKIYQEADLILAKGMGNFESMENAAKQDKRIFLLFKIKCNVVRDYLQQNLGDFVFFSPILHPIPQ